MFVKCDFGGVRKKKNSTRTFQVNCETRKTNYAWMWENEEYYGIRRYSTGTFFSAWIPVVFNEERKCDRKIRISRISQSDDSRDGFNTCRTCDRSLVTATCGHRYRCVDDTRRKTTIVSNFYTPVTLVPNPTGWSRAIFHTDNPVYPDDVTSKLNYLNVTSKPVVLTLRLLFAVPR